MSVSLLLVELRVHLATIGGIFAHVGWVSRRKAKKVLNIVGTKKPSFA
jgi:hypothetical protein